MKRRVAGWVLSGCVGAWPAACGAEQPPLAAAGGGTSVGVGGSRRADGNSVAGELSAPSAGGALESGAGADAGGAPGDRLPIGTIGGGNYAEPIGGAPPSLPATCDPAPAWRHPTPLVGISGAADERLLTMTHDERTLVFSRDKALFVADRTSADVDFDDPQPLELPEGYDAERGLALGPDGLALILVEADGASIAELTRRSRSAPFVGEPTSGRFDAVNDARLFSGAELSSPVLSEDGKTFFYVERSADRSDVWRATGSRLDERVRLDAVALGADGGLAKLTLSVSSDARTLFVLDEALDHVVGLWSATPGAEFTEAVPLPELTSAFTNIDCTRLYATRDSGASLDIVIETL